MPSQADSERLDVTYEVLQPTLLAPAVSLWVSKMTLKFNNLLEGLTEPSKAGTGTDIVI